MAEKGMYHQDIKMENVVVGMRQGWDSKNFTKRWNEYHGIEDQAEHENLSVFDLAILLATPMSKKFKGLGEGVSGKRKRDDNAEAAMRWAVEASEFLHTMVIDFDRSVSMSSIPRLDDIKIDGTAGIIDPLRVVTEGVISEYKFAPSTPQQMVAAALYGGDLWSLGVLCFDVINNTSITNLRFIEKTFTDLPGVDQDSIIEILEKITDEDEAMHNHISQILARQESGGVTMRVNSEVEAWDVLSPLLSYRLSDRYSTDLTTMASELMRL